MLGSVVEVYYVVEIFLLRKSKNKNKLVTVLGGEKKSV